MKNVQRSFWWPGYRQDVTLYVKHCLSCARKKPAQHKPYGLLSPLPVPEKLWDSISMDFITDLPNTEAKHDAILVVVDRLSKMTHSIPCANTCTAQQALKMFTHIFRLHGSPTSIVVDRDPLWWRAFFQSWSALLGTTGIQMSTTAYHPQTDGQTERMNRTLEKVLRLYQSLTHNLGITPSLGRICNKFCISRVH
jgi:Integrase zinc binding domain